MNAFDHITPADFAPNSAVILDGYGQEVIVPIRKGYFRGVKVYRFLAPGWRAMNYADPCRAAAKLASHFRFVRWTSEGF